MQGAHVVYKILCRAVNVAMVTAGKFLDLQNFADFIKDDKIKKAIIFVSDVCLLFFAISIVHGFFLGQRIPQRPFVARALDLIGGVLNIIVLVYGSKDHLFSYFLINIIIYIFLIHIDNIITKLQQTTLTFLLFLLLLLPVRERREH